MCEVVILSIIPDLTKPEFDALLLLLSPEKQKRIKRYRFFRDAQNTLLGDVLARTEICRVTGQSIEQLDFTTNEYGKPFLTHLSKDGLAINPYIHHNISHTGSYVACAVADKPVGIDIESIKSVDLKIAERFFAPDETEYIMNDSQTRRFIEVWTKKESLIKWEGKGLSKPLPSFSVISPKESEDPTYHEVFHNDEVICHLCICDKNKPSVKMIDTFELLRQLMNRTRF